MKAEHMWLGLGASIITYDLLCPENQTLSEAFRKQPRALQLGELALLGVHLLEVAPRLDPIRQGFELVKGQSRGFRTK